VTGSTQPKWEITTARAHSPTHSWTDSDGTNYTNNETNILQTRNYNLLGKRYVQVSGWSQYALEAGYDYVYLDYSTDGGLTWSSDAEALAVFNGFQPDWTELVVDAPMLDDQQGVVLRFRLETDFGVVEDGIYLDDIALTHEPFMCSPPNPASPQAPSLVLPADHSLVSSPVTFAWVAAGAGGPPEGYRLIIDTTPVLTVTAVQTSATLDLAFGAHTWTVQAYNPEGSSPLSPSRTFTVAHHTFLPVIHKPGPVH
jgi:hypothetical protein